MELRPGPIAAYARYSSDKQNESSIDDQLRRLHQFAEVRGREISSSLILTDEGISGSSLARPGFERLMEKVRNREVEVVLVEDTSRLSRDNADALMLYKTFAFFGVQLVAISDGIDSGSKGAKLAYSVKALMSDLYLEDLRDKTLRGMEGRAHAGLATGGRLLGYRSVEVPGPDPRRPLGFRVEIDEAAAATVRQIFEMWIAGQSLNAIATHLNESGVHSPRDHTRHERKCGWSGATIREMLSNERYRGVCRFNERRWIKVPGTNKRVPRRNAPEQIISRHRPELAIVDEDTWHAAQARRQHVRHKYTVTEDGQLKGRSLVKRCKTHPLSGLLYCECGAPMTIHGGYEKRRYYACVGSRRGRCKHSASVREDIIQQRVMDEIARLMTAPKAYEHVKQQISEELERSSADTAQTIKRRERAAELEQKLGRIVGALSDEKCSASLSEGLRALEIELAAAREGIRATDYSRTRRPALRSRAEVSAKLTELRRQLQTAPLQARETLRQLCARGVITLTWTPPGHYVASLEIVPAVLFVESPRLFASAESKVRLQSTIALR